MSFEFYRDQPSTTGGSSERVLIKNDTSSTISLLTTDNDFEPYNEEKDKDAFLFDFEKDPEAEEDGRGENELIDDDWAENELITVLYNADDLSYEGTLRPTTNKLINHTSEAIRLIRLGYDGISERLTQELQPGHSIARCFLDSILFRCL